MKIEKFRVFPIPTILLCCPPRNRRVGCCLGSRQAGVVFKRQLAVSGHHEDLAFCGASIRLCRERQRKDLGDLRWLDRPLRMGYPPRAARLRGSVSSTPRWVGCTASSCCRMVGTVIAIRSTPSMIRMSPMSSRPKIGVGIWSQGELCFCLVPG